MNLMTILSNDQLSFCDQKLHARCTPNKQFSKLDITPFAIY